MGGRGAARFRADCPMSVRLSPSGTALRRRSSAATASPARRSITKRRCPRACARIMKPSATLFHRPVRPRFPAGSTSARSCSGSRRSTPISPTERHILPWAQYWSWLLSGVAASEVTSLGCHTDLWNPLTGEASALAERRGWAARLAPLRGAGDILGTLTPAWVAAHRPARRHRSPLRAARFERSAACGTRLCRKSQTRNRRCCRRVHGSLPCDRPRTPRRWIRAA